ncbi:hypothetical protein R3P38DRAFT_2808674 [Favolaschia claudopus]|uniref:Uncharacterized protein n=1 Tax=Favolaschia claudopus TaxID=2862362 RepID=A0AAV9ZFS5_9AGAR
MSFRIDGCAATFTVRWAPLARRLRYNEWEAHIAMIQHLPCEAEDWGIIFREMDPFYLFYVATIVLPFYTGLNYEQIPGIKDIVWLKTHPDDAHRRALVIIRKYRSQGFTLVIGYQQKHICGIDKSCPATKRSNRDEGCALAQFAKIPPGRTHFSPALIVSHEEVSWDLGGRDCNSHNSMEDAEIEAVSADCEQHCYDAWCTIAQCLLDMEDDEELISDSEEEEEDGEEEETGSEEGEEDSD